MRGIGVTLHFILQDSPEPISLFDYRENGKCEFLDYEMLLTLIGMAGTGKSFWSDRLTEIGFRRFCCDDMIAARLAPELKCPDGSVMTMGEWMGFPFMPHYREHEERYLTYEKEILREILGYIESPERDPDERIVVDSSGSVIYAGEDLLHRLGKLTTTVLLMTPPREQARLLKAYLSNPHPMLWRGHYARRGGETSKETLERCYLELFLSRKGLYERYARIRLDYDRLREQGFGVEDFLMEVHALSRKAPNPPA